MVLAMAAAFALGFAGHAITDPHRVDLLSASLIGIVLWNLLVYALLLLTWLRSLVRRRKTVIAPLEPEQGQGAVAALVAGCKSCRQGGGSVSRGTGLRKMALNFERNWWQVNQRPRHAQWLVCLHLVRHAGAGRAGIAMADRPDQGVSSGLGEHFPSPSAVQTCLNMLFAPVQHLLGLAPWSLAQIQALQGWSAGDAADAGPRWVQLYSWLLGLMVVAPRLLLALWQGARVWWLSQHLALPLQQPYFQKLQRDWAGRATALLVQPYSLDITPEREAALRNHVAQSYGAGAQLALLPVLAYGSPLPDALAVDAQQVLLLNLAATPEAEIHGVLLAQVLNRWARLMCGYGRRIFVRATAVPRRECRSASSCGGNSWRRGPERDPGARRRSVMMSESNVLVPSDNSIQWCLLSHTNIGKTTLTRTLMADDVGEIDDAAHVTTQSQRYLLQKTQQGDECGFGIHRFRDSVRLYERLRQQGNPLGWFLSNVRDRWRDKPFT
jgi:hypothetical protein